MSAKLVNSTQWDFGLIHSGTKDGKFHNFGFDPEKQFQMLAINDRKLFSITRAGPSGLTVSINPPSICDFVDTPDLTAPTGDASKSGIIVIQGNAIGSATMSLLDAKGVTIDKVEIKVVDPKVLNIRYYNLVDGLGRQGVTDPGINPLFDVAALSDLTDGVNDIVLAQCGVALVPTDTGVLRDLIFHEDLRDRVDILLPFIPFGSSNGLDPKANYHVAFTWALKDPHDNGLTKGVFTLLKVSLDIEKRQQTLAHEFVHFLSHTGAITPGDHDDRHSDLMFATAPHGVNMRKERLIKSRTFL